jgi:hypothetical protein
MNVSPPKGNINRYRDACRELIYACRDPKLTRARKSVLLALVDAVNDKEGYTAWPAFDTLAERVGVDRRTAIRAINVGRKLRILQRIYKGGQTWRGGTSNRYRFCIDPVSGESLGQRVPDDNLVSGQTPTQCQSGAQPSVRRDTRSSNDPLTENLNGAASSAASESVVGVAQERGFGEEGRESKPSSDDPTAKPAGMPKPTDAELCIEMTAKGMDMSQSKLRRYRATEIYSAPPVPDERPITIGQALIDQIKKKGAAA